MVTPCASYFVQRVKSLLGILSASLFGAALWKLNSLITVEMINELFAPRS